MGGKLSSKPKLPAGVRAQDRVAWTALVVFGHAQGFVSEAELNARMPDDLHRTRDIDAWLQGLSEAGIELRTTAIASSPPPSAEDAAAQEIGERANAQRRRILEILLADPFGPPFLLSLPAVMADTPPHHAALIETWPERIAETEEACGRLREATTTAEQILAIWDEYRAHGDLIERHLATSVTAAARPALAAERDELAATLVELAMLQRDAARELANTHDGGDLAERIVAAEHGLAYAARHFEPERGHRFSTTVRLWVTAALRGVARRSGGSAG